MRYLIFLFLLYFTGPLAAQPYSTPCYSVPQSNCQPVGANTPLPVTLSPSGATVSTPVDCSVTSATGAAQKIITAAQNKHGFLLEVGVNDSNTDPAYWSITNTTPAAGATGVFSLNPSTSTSAGGSFSTPINFPVGVDVWLFMTTIGDKLKCNVW